MSINPCYTIYYSLEMAIKKYKTKSSIKSSDKQIHTSKGKKKCHL